MIEIVCITIFCFMGLALPVLLAVDFKRLGKGKRSIFFEDNNEEE